MGGAAAPPPAPTPAPPREQPGAVLYAPAPQPAPVHPATGTQQGSTTAPRRLEDSATATTVKFAGSAVAAPAAPPAPPSAPGGSGPVGPPSRREPDRTAWRPRTHLAIPRLRIGLHHASEEALHRLQVTGSSVGLPLGRDHTGLPVTTTLFRPEPVSAALVGGDWAVRTIAVRALRFGARVLVVTDRPSGWSTLGKSVTGRSDRVAVAPPDLPADVAASADAPVLWVQDTFRPSPPVEARPWCTRLVMLRRLTPERSADLPADVVFLQRLTPNEATGVAAVLRLAPHTAQNLTRLRDDMVALVSARAVQPVVIDVSAAERQLLGAPGRH